MSDKLFFMHATTEVSSDAHIGIGSRIWNLAQVRVREHAYIGEECNIGKGVYIDTHLYRLACENLEPLLHL